CRRSVHQPCPSAPATINNVIAGLVPAIPNIKSRHELEMWCPDYRDRRNKSGDDDVGDGAYWLSNRQGVKEAAKVPLLSAFPPLPNPATMRRNRRDVSAVPVRGAKYRKQGIRRNTWSKRTRVPL